MFRSKKQSEGTRKKPEQAKSKPQRQSKGLKYLGGLLFSRMAAGGAARLRSNADEVNKLNVFPVPDGDTGDNMRMTIESGIAAIENLDTDDLAEVMRVLSHGMLLGARGNSGVILSQFFAGAAKGFEGVEKAFAIQAGRELRVMVKPEDVSDEGMKLIARDMAKKIQDEVKYPGQIKVNLIRESRAVDYAK